MLIDPHTKNAERMARINATMKALRLRRQECHTRAAQILEHSRRTAENTRRLLAQARGTQGYVRSARENDVESLAKDP